MHGVIQSKQWGEQKSKRLPHSLKFPDIANQDPEN